MDGHQYIDTTREGILSSCVSSISVFDTAIDSDNIGDEIIMDAVWGIIRTALPGIDIRRRIATHSFMGPKDYAVGLGATLSIVGGTNILKSRMFVRGNWRLTPLDLALWRNVVLLGVGWQHYMGQPDPLSRLFFRTVLSRTHLHSVRDRYSMEKLAGIVPNLVYTSCPTLWRMTPAACGRIPTRKARKAVFAVTYYRPAPEADRAILALLRQRYDEVYFWPQQAKDVAYAAEHGLTGMTLVPANLGAYDILLDSEDVDFIGARLHGGIRALQRGRRALILAVDNRAIEMGADTDLPVGTREDIAAIERWIDGGAPTSIRLPWDAIAAWKGQFQSLQRAES